MGEDGSGTGRNKEGGEAGGSRGHGGQKNALPWHHRCRGGAEAWEERRDLKVASQNWGAPSPLGVQECPREDSTSHRRLGLCSFFQP